MGQNWHSYGMMYIHGRKHCGVVRWKVLVGFGNSAGQSAVVGDVLLLGPLTEQNEIDQIQAQHKKSRE
jgi:hypothetical protein